MKEQIIQRKYKNSYGFVLFSGLANLCFFFSLRAGLIEKGLWGEEGTAYGSTMLLGVFSLITIISYFVLKYSVENWQDIILEGEIKKEATRW